MAFTLLLLLLFFFSFRFVFIYVWHYYDYCYDGRTVTSDDCLRLDCVKLIHTKTQTDSRTPCICSVHTHARIAYELCVLEPIDIKIKRQFTFCVAKMPSDNSIRTQLISNGNYSDLLNSIGDDLFMFISVDRLAFWPARTRNEIETTTYGPRG